MVNSPWMEDAMSRPLAAALGLIAAGLCVAALSPPRGRCGEGYVVARGDTLSRIARRCRTSVAAIARASGIADPDRLLVGQRLVVRGGRMARAAPPRRGGDRLAYAFAQGDTLYSLARWSRVSLPGLMAVNPGIDPRKIEIGDPVRLPAGASDPALARQRERGREGPALRAHPPRRSAPVRRQDSEPEPEPEGM